jgi:hypothetical protein
LFTKKLTDISKDITKIENICDLKSKHSLISGTLVLMKYDSVDNDLNNLYK